MSTHAISRDAACAAQIREFHAQLVDELGGLVDRMAAASAATATASHTGTDARDAAEFAAAKADLLRWADAELAPHTARDEQTVYHAAHAIKYGRPLVEALLSDHRLMAGFVDEIDATQDQCVATTWATALLRVFTEHAQKENDLVLPILLADPSTDLATLLHELHDLAS